MAGKKLKKKAATIGVVAAVIIGGAGIAAYAFISGQPAETKKTETTAAKTASDTVKKDPGSDATSFTETKEYKNSRYAFKVLYPADWTSKASQNGDGTVLSKEGDSSMVIKIYCYTNDQMTLLGNTYKAMEDERATRAGFSVISRQDSVVAERPAKEGTWVYTAGDAESPLTGLIRTRVMVLQRGEGVYVLEMNAADSAFDDWNDSFGDLVKGFLFD